MPRDGRLGLIDFEVESNIELLQARQPPFAHPATAHIFVAVIGVAHEVMPPSHPFPIYLVEQHIGQERGWRFALRRPLVSLHDHAAISANPSPSKTPVRAHLHRTSESGPGAPAWAGSSHSELRPESEASALSGSPPSRQSTALPPQLPQLLMHCTSERELRGLWPARPARQRPLSGSCQSARSLCSTLPPCSVTLSQLRFTSFAVID